MNKKKSNLINYTSKHTGACYDFFYPSTTLKNTREESQMSNCHTTLFQNSFVIDVLTLFAIILVPI